MSIITSVEPQKTLRLRSGRRRFNIFLDGKFAFGADADLVVNFRLVCGKEISKEDLEKILFEAEIGKLLERMYGFISLRMRSEKEIRDRLKLNNFKLKIKEKQEVSDLVINSLIEKLKEKGLINDLEFAKAWVESRRRSKQKGVKALKMELMQKGIEREIVEEVLSEPFGFAQGEEDLAKLALEKKMRVWKNLPEQEFKKKAYEFLLRRGFDYEIVRKTIHSLVK